MMAITWGTLEHIESYVPARRLTIEELAEPLGLSRVKISLFRKVHGLHALRENPSDSVYDLALRAARRVVERVPDPSRIQYLLYAHAINEIAPAGTDVVVGIRNALGLHHAEAFAFGQQNCAGGLGAIDVAVQLLANGNHEAQALLVTGEKPHSPMIRTVPNTAIMGEAGAACLIALGGSGDPVLSNVSCTLGQYAQLVGLAPELSALYAKSYAPVLADVIRRAVFEARLTLDDIDLIIPHNVNRLAWRSTAAELGLPLDRVFLDNVPRYSHCFASDPFVNYTTLRDTGRLVQGHHYLMACVGAGATFAALVLTYRGGA